MTTDTVIAALLLGALPVPRATATAVIEVATPAELRQAFCAADASAEHIIVMPARMFVDAQELVCPAGPYKLYRVRESKDPDDFEYYIDPPFCTTGRLACDGKAGQTMSRIAVNCRPL
ncbi:hypothetical protein V5F53_20930 [Xanthobacter sp. V4C-4]|uniref:hypothetical protein n=1 Tax=Xanthobacter cornucopiae TaxID=3119924 RepID=UPI00372B9762